MNRPNRLVLVRHAESARNEAKKGATYFADEEARERVKGIPDHLIPITDRGWTQARATGHALREKYGTFDYIFHSGYRRTIETTRGILEAYTPTERAAMKVRENLFIRERDPGYTYDMTTEEAETAFPYLKEYWKTFGGFMARPPGGQSLADVAGNTHVFLNKLIRDHAGQNILAITHGGTLRCFRYLLEHWNYEQVTRWNGEPHPENASATEYLYDPSLGRLALQSYNQIFWQLPPADESDIL